MKTSRILMAAIAAALISSPVLANDAAKTAPKMEGPGHWKSLDTNNDGNVSKDEWIAGAQSKFDELDANKDGQISKDEFAARRAEMKQKFSKKHGKVDGASTSTPAANNEAAGSKAKEGADGAGGATAQ